MKPSNRLPWRLSIFFTVLLLTACSIPKTKPQPVYYYTLDNKPLELSFPNRVPAVVRVERFAAGPPYDSQQIIYGDKGLYRNAYANFKWIALPGELLAYDLARDMQQCGGFQAVLTPQASSPPTHAINGFVEQFLEEDFSEPAQAALKVGITLIDTREPDPIKRILLQKNYSFKSPCEEKTPAALAQAMSAAAAKLNAQIIQDIHRCLSQTSSHTKD
ncbi:MAG: ABC-type transport auxiliary lipoprotein family protein [Desulfobacteraceae bacterium]|nr:ABC-type transport auxiliary lipoprotein family protein [Desulfobacteraceae bacterium]